MRVWPGEPYPLGATWDGEGVNFAVFSEHATTVELCLYYARDHSRESPEDSRSAQTLEVRHDRLCLRTR
jgi:isoamylase